MSLLDSLTDSEVADLVRILPDSILASYVRNGVVSPAADGRRGPRQTLRGEFWSLIVATAAKYHVKPEEVCGRVRTRGVAAARAEVMAAMRATGMTLSEIGRLFGRDHTSVMHACSPERREARNAERRVAHVRAA